MHIGKAIGVSLGEMRFSGENSNSACYTVCSSKQKCVSVKGPSHVPGRRLRKIVYSELHAIGGSSPSVTLVTEPNSSFNSEFLGSNCYY